MARDQQQGFQSIEDALFAVEDALGRIKPADASLWAVVQSSRESIHRKRTEGASWAQIAAAFREAGFPSATETNVRLAHQSSEPLKKVARARRRRAKQNAPQKETTLFLPERDPPLLGNGPSKLKSRFDD